MQNEGSQRDMYRTQHIATHFCTERRLMILKFLVPGQLELLVI